MMWRTKYMYANGSSIAGLLWMLQPEMLCSITVLLSSCVNFVFVMDDPPSNQTCDYVIDS